MSVRRLIAGEGIALVDEPGPETLEVKLQAATTRLLNLLNDVVKHGADPTNVADSLAAFNAAGAIGPGFIPPGNYKLSAVPTGDFWHLGGVTFSNNRPGLFFAPRGNGAGRIRNSQTPGRQELQLYSAGLAYGTGSRGAGMHLYGNADDEHAGNWALMTGQDDDGDARIIVRGGSSNPSSGGYLGLPGTNPVDTRVTIGNGIFDWVDAGNDTAMLNLKNPTGRPAVCFFGTSGSEGELVVPTGEQLALGHWSGAVFSPRLVMDGSGRWVMGAASAYAGDDINTPQLQVHGLTQSEAGLGLANWSATPPSDARFSFLRSMSGVAGTHGILVNGVETGTMAWGGSDGVTFVRGALIYAEVHGAPGLGSMPMRLKLCVTPAGSGVPALAMDIQSDRSITTTGARYLRKRVIAGGAGTTALDAFDHVVVATGTGAKTLPLPPAVDGRELVIKNRSSGVVTVPRDGSDTIDGGTAALTLAAGQARHLVADGSDWCVVGSA